MPERRASKGRSESPVYEGKLGKELRRRRQRENSFLFVNGLIEERELFRY